MYINCQQKLLKYPKVWLITGVAGFIGSNLLEHLLKLNQTVIGLDNLSTGYRQNLEEVLSNVNPEQAERFTFVEGDICDLEVCRKCCGQVDVVLHQAAVGSVYLSISDPITTNQNNIDGFLNVLVAVKEKGVKRFVYASSSSIYGDYIELPKVEEKIGKPLSPYAITKYTNELYASVFGKIYGLQCIGLRYFNIFGPRQDPCGSYAAVIPLWFAGLIQRKPVYINGDGETSRDFCFIDNVVQANILAACVDKESAIGQSYNVGFGQRTTLNELFRLIKELVIEKNPDAADRLPIYSDFRDGDIRHSHADISKAINLLGYMPRYSVKDGLREAAYWYIKKFSNKPSVELG